MRVKNRQLQEQQRRADDRRKPIGQGSAYLVGSFHSAQCNQLTCFEILDNVSDCLSFLRCKHSGLSFFWSDTHSTLKQSHICTHALCASQKHSDVMEEWAECSAALRCTISCSSFSSREHCILKNRERVSQSRKWKHRCPHNNLTSQLPGSSDHSNVYSEGNGNTV